MMNATLRGKPDAGNPHVRFEEGKAPEAVARADFAATETMCVPGCFDVLPKYLCKRGTALYRRTFTLERSVANAWLVVDGMGLRGKFRVDGRDLGTKAHTRWVKFAKLRFSVPPC